MALELKASVRDDASPTILRISVSAAGRRAFAAIGASMAQYIRDHLVAKDQTPNRLGGRRTHFYAAAAEATHWDAYPTEAVVSISKDGIRQRYLGGDIRPVNRKFLTVPIHPEAHGRAASEFGPELRMIALGGGRDGNTGGLLVMGDGPDAVALYVLKTLVRQAPDPTVLPTDADLQKEAVSAAEELALAP